MVSLKVLPNTDVDDEIIKFVEKKCLKTFFFNLERLFKNNQTCSLIPAFNQSRHMEYLIIRKYFGIENKKQDKVLLKLKVFHRKIFLS
jgi:hypothetical protein